MSKTTTKILLSMMIIIVLISDQVYANSSWIWVTTSPLTILPIAVALTLAIEIMGLKVFNKELRLKKIVYVVALSNLVSFLLPYIERAYRFIPTSGGFSITAAFNKGPFYIVMMGYLMLTLIIEMPIVVFLLRKESLQKTRLIITVLLTNILTTGLVALLERVACKGVW